MRSMIWLPLLAVLCGVMAGCQETVEVAEEDTAPPPPVFTGPRVFYTTVGSMAKIPAEDARPLLVSGFGLVAGLNNTGSAEVPEAIRSRLLNDIRRRGFGDPLLGMQGWTPRRVLSDLRTAVVTVEALVPPGATKGQRFDVLVRALPQTQTTSLFGGQLYTADLSIQGANPRIEFSQTYGSASGPLYINPFREEIPEKEQVKLQRRAVVLSGGVVTNDRRLRLVLNQPHWKRCRLIADRINERFPQGRGDRELTAIAKNDAMIAINVPKRWQNDTARLLGLIQHLYVQQGIEFEPQRAGVLGQLLVEDSTYAGRVALAWEALGRTVVPVIGQYYDHPDLDVRLAALQAGVRLDDGRTIDHLAALAEHSNPDARQRAAELIVYMLPNVHLEHKLSQLLNDSNLDVRLAAYWALSDRSHPLVVRRVFTDEDERFQFVLDVVDSQRPMVYLTQSKLPRVVVFNPHTGFRLPMVASVWDGRMMIRAEADRAPASVYFRPFGETEGQVVSIAPTVANLVLLLGGRPAMNERDHGFGLSYVRVANALFRLHESGDLRAPLELETSPLADLISEQQQAVDERPETTPRLEQEQGRPPADEQRSPQERPEVNDQSSPKSE